MLGAPGCEGYGGWDATATAVEAEELLALAFVLVLGGTATTPIGSGASFWAMLRRNS